MSKRTPKKKASGPFHIGSDKLAWVIAGLLIGCSTALMLAGARGDLWFDEILSFQWARNAKSPLDLLALYRHDNNHPINTLWIYLLGEGLPSIVYRTLSIFSGATSLVLLFRIAGILMPAARFHVLALASFSYAMVLYASEARGYAPAIACGLGCFLILLQTKRIPHPVWTPVFCSLSILGLLAHATLIYPLAAMGTWVLVCGMTERLPWVRILAHCAAWFMVPAAAAVAYYLYFLKPMMIAGGPQYSLPRIAAEFFGYGIGLPTSPALAPLTLGISAILLVTALAKGNFAAPQMRMLFVLSILVFPIFGLFVSGAEFLYFRYFIVVLPFVFLLVGGLFDYAINSGRTGKVIASIAVLAMVAFQIPRIGNLIDDGRGRYQEALAFIASSPAREISVISDHDMLVGMVTEFYRAKSASLSTIRYFPSWGENPAQADWLITHNQGPSGVEQPANVKVGPITYRLERIFPAAPVSGANWFVYRAMSEGPSR